MFVLCPECRSHYDDSAQSKKCNGIGKSGSHVSTGLSPLGEHVTYTRLANQAAAAEPYVADPADDAAPVASAGASAG